MNVVLGFAVGLTLLGLGAFSLMLLAGVVHGLVPAVPAISYGSSLVVSVLYGAWHNAVTWPGAGHKIEDQ